MNSRDEERFAELERKVAALWDNAFATLPTPAPPPNPPGTEPEEDAV